MSDAIALFRGSRRFAARRARVSMRRYLALMFDAWRTRRILAEMDPWQLKDIGVSRAEAQAEVSRAPWDFTTRR